MRIPGLIGIMVLVTACSRTTSGNRDFLHGQEEVQYRVEEDRDGRKEVVYFIFRDDGTWVNHYINRRDSLVPFEPIDVKFDETYKYWGDSLYVWGYTWDVIHHGPDSLRLKMHGSDRIWRLTKTNYPVVKR